MNKKSLLKLQCVAALALTTFSPALSTVQTVYAAETSSTTSVSDQFLKTNFSSKSDQSALFRISKTGDQSLKITRIEIVDSKTGESQRLFTEKIISEDMTLRDGSIVGSFDAKKGQSYFIKIDYDKSELKSKEATLTSAVLLKDGSTSSSAKRFNSKVDLDKLQDDALSTLKSKSEEIERKIRTEELHHVSELEISSYDMTKDLSTGKLKVEDLKTYSDEQKKNILDRVSKFSALDQSLKDRLQSLRDELANEVFKNPSATAESIQKKLTAFIGAEEEVMSSKKKESSTSDFKIEDVKKESDKKLDSSDNKSNLADKKDQTSDIKNEPAKVDKPTDSKTDDKSKKSSKVDTSKLEEVLKISEELLSRKVDTSKVSEEGKKNLEQSKNNLAQRVERYKSLVKSEKVDEKSVNVAIEDLRAAAGHYSLLLDLKSSIDTQNQSQDKKDQSVTTSDQTKDQTKDQNLAKDADKDAKSNQNNSQDRALDKSNQKEQSSGDKSQNSKSKESNSQGKTPKKYADTGEKDNFVASILGMMGLTAIIGLMYKNKRRS